MRLCFIIRKRETIGYFEGNLRTSSAVILSTTTGIIKPKHDLLLTLTYYLCARTESDCKQHVGKTRNRKLDQRKRKVATDQRFEETAIAISHRLFTLSLMIIEAVHQTQVNMD